eukprot:TRINITY_DN11556_c0_g2_i5.p1 TRINITY_DN11556_c0_g2~~TRINITY_DN11556_c0_g2_i5.p1  ORF type:complete len:237 (+),score=42.16 TRINITY_DN11556_c0_g2_i5:83-712(+)
MTSVSKMLDGWLPERYNEDIDLEKLLEPKPPKPRGDPWKRPIRGYVGHSFDPFFDFKPTEKMATSPMNHGELLLRAWRGQVKEYRDRHIWEWKIREKAKFEFDRAKYYWRRHQRIERQQQSRFFKNEEKHKKDMKDYINRDAENKRIILIEQNRLNEEGRVHEGNNYCMHFIRDERKSAWMLTPEDITEEIGRAVQQECRDRSRMPSSA